MASDVRREANAGLREDERAIEIRAVESSLALPDRFFRQRETMSRELEGPRAKYM